MKLHQRACALGLTLARAASVSTLAGRTLTAAGAIHHVEGKAFAG